MKRCPRRQSTAVTRPETCSPDQRSASRPSHRSGDAHKRCSALRSDKLGIDSGLAHLVRADEDISASRRNRMADLTAARLHSGSRAPGTSQPCVATASRHNSCIVDFATGQSQIETIASTQLTKNTSIQDYLAVVSQSVELFGAGSTHIVSLYSNRIAPAPWTRGRTRLWRCRRCGTRSRPVRW